ncbi:MAG: RNA polymerase-associated protein RapA, partial [Fibrobacteria bacterium]|nr:RNA polymerase-associated protein RapA [Fibrobacteria bacterium]
SFKKGQRWQSEPEPELGLGTIVAIEGRNIRITFTASEEMRLYRIENNPLTRVRFKTGDKISNTQKKEYTVTSVEEKDGLFWYHCEDEFLPETELADTIAFNQPEDRLSSGQFGYVKDFTLRLQTLHHRYRTMASPLRGLIGARVQLIAHQLFIANEISNRQHPRALLADEVGLGKTIEAGLIFHRLHISGRIKRTLIITPNSLVHQWLVEMYRRFNHMFSILDEDTLPTLTQQSFDQNPFNASSEIICSLDLLSADTALSKQAQSAKWDLVIVDEAHHLDFKRKKKSAEYRAVEAVSQSSKGLLLLTGTPLQLEEEGHFGRLRLIDPYRFNSFQNWKNELTSYKSIAAITAKIVEKQMSPPEVMQYISEHYPTDTALIKQASLLDSFPEAREEFIQDLIDRHGTGRMVYRNRRTVIKGFPPRKLIETALKPGQNYLSLFNKTLQHIKPNIRAGFKALFFDPFQLTPSCLELPIAESSRLIQDLWKNDPRISWLVGFLASLKPSEKTLLICSSQAKIMALQETLPKLIKIPFTVFHESLTLTGRDHNAADFASPGGVKFMLSSEIGSEGRNFQFAQRLILFDLPANPSLLEQRIGRLHRIGQTGTIRIYVPYVYGTPLEILYYWYNNGLDAFIFPTMGIDNLMHDSIPFLELKAQECFNSLGKECAILPEIKQKANDLQLQKNKIRESLKAGRDRLLETNSLQLKNAEDLITALKHEDDSKQLEDYLELVFDSFGVDFNPTVEERGYAIYPGPEMVLDSFPELPDMGLNVTFSRTQALTREDLTFLSWDHPLVIGAMDLILGTSDNIICVAEWDEAPSSDLWLELVFIMEPISQKDICAAHFLSPVPIHILLDRKGLLQENLHKKVMNSRLKQAPTAWLQENNVLKNKLLPSLIKAGSELANQKADMIKSGITEKVSTQMNNEHKRLIALKDLGYRNQGFYTQEADKVKHEQEIILKNIGNAPVHLDSLRVIIAGK